MPSTTIASIPVEARRSRLIAALTAVWRATRETAATYRALAEMETDSQRAHLLFGLAEFEEKYARRWRARLRESGAAEPEWRGAQSGTAKSWANRVSGLDGAYHRTELVRERRLRAFARQTRSSGDKVSAAILAEVLRGEDTDERALLNRLSSSSRSSCCLGSFALPFPTHDRRQRYPISADNADRATGDALRGVHNGLTTVFIVLGVVAGVTTRAPGISRASLLAGLAGTVAASLLAGASAYAAARSEREKFATEARREQATREADPDEARRTLSLHYQTKGVPAPDADRLAAWLLAAPGDFIYTTKGGNANEELRETPWAAAFAGASWTALGALAPLLSFLFLHGSAAILAADAVSLVAFFAVGAARSVIAVRRWWTSGMEALLFGVMAGVASYGIGLILGALATLQR